MKSYLDYWKITFICGKITVTIRKITLISGKLHFSFENNLFIGKITLIIEKSPLLMQNHLCYWKITSISGKPPLLMENHLFQWKITFKVSQKGFGCIPHSDRDTICWIKSRSSGSEGGGSRFIPNVWLLPGLSQLLSRSMFLSIIC